MEPTNDAQVVPVSMSAEVVVNAVTDVRQSLARASELDLFHDKLLSQLSDIGREPAVKGNVLDVQRVPKRDHDFRLRHRDTLGDLRGDENRLLELLHELKSAGELIDEEFLETCLWHRDCDEIIDVCNCTHRTVKDPIVDTYYH